MGTAMGQIMPLTGGNVMDTSAGAYNAAVDKTQQGMEYNPMAAMGQYMNPYQQDVIDASMSDLNQANQMALANVGATADAQSAFGGSRHGVAESLTNQQFADAAQGMTSGLRQQSFQNALNTANQVQNNQMNAANQMANLSQQGFNFGQTLNNNMMDVGNAQQNLNQQIINAAMGQYGNITGYPQNQLQLPLQALGMAPGSTGGTTTSSYTPGLFDYLRLGAQMPAYGSNPQPYYQFGVLQ